jgi:hypothetical protein
MIFGGVVAAALVFAAVALGLTAAELEPKANEWQAKACVASLLTSKKAKAGQEAAVCYSLKEIDRVKTEMARAEAEAVSLRERIDHLEARQAPAPMDFTFFSNLSGPPEERPVPFETAPTYQSPIADAGPYTSVTVTASCSSSQSSMRLEWSADQNRWYSHGMSAGDHFTEATNARYYRITFQLSPEQRNGNWAVPAYNCSVIGRFST